jgi:hypothetical protein
LKEFHDMKGLNPSEATNRNNSSGRVKRLAGAT